DLNGFNDNIGTLNLIGGNVTTGIGQVGVTHVNTSASPQTATISGRMDMLSVMGEFNVADGAAAIDLDVSGRIQDGNMRKFGSGVMRLSGTTPNDLQTTLVNGGLLILNKTGADAINGFLVIGDALGGGTVRLDQNDQLGDFGNITINA